MDMRKVRIPSLGLHKASGQAVVRLNGRDVYCGRWGTPEAQERYQRLMAEWLAAGRALPVEAAQVMPGPAGAVVGPGPGLTVTELLAAYWPFAEVHYRKDGQRTTELDNVRDALQPLRRLYGSTLAAAFGPKALKAVRQAMIEAGLSRGVINSRIGRIKRVFRWAVEEELVAPSDFHGLQAVRGLLRGRSEAREVLPVRPVPDEHVQATLPHLSRPVAAMVELMGLTGMRVGEVVQMRTADMDRAGELWIYRPASHKTAHHGHARTIVLGPKAQTVVRPFLRADPQAPLFSPVEAEEARRRKLRVERRTPMTPSQRARTRKAHPQHQPGDRYGTEAVYRAVDRACRKAGVPHWHPHQLRHTAATRLRRQFGIEAARVILGHHSPAMTDLYAEIDEARAREIMMAVG